MRLSLLVTTFDRPDALACVLASVERQSQLPDEVIIADDGSGPLTRRVIEDFQRRLTQRTPSRSGAGKLGSDSSLTPNQQTPIHHAWQRHDGPRVGRARNVGIAMASGDYLVQIDGDMALHPEFVADHARAARHGHWVQGTRILLDEARTRELIASGPRPFGFFSAGLGFKRRAYAVHSPVAGSLFRRTANAFIAIKGCNQGFWRRDLERVNGYDEAMIGWGAEDKELAARLIHAGVRRTTLLFAGIAYHLHHERAPRDREAINNAILRETLKSRRVRCLVGLDGHR